MQSTSSLTITWQKPDIGEEEWEFHKHPAKQEYYRRHGICWERLVAAFEGGRLEQYPRSDRILGRGRAAGSGTRGRSSGSRGGAQAVSAKSSRPMSMRRISEVPAPIS